MSKLSQKDAILAFLKTCGSITPYDAFKLCGSLSLSSRINELRKEGYPIGTHPKKVNGKRVSCHYLVRKNGKARHT